MNRRNRDERTVTVRYRLLAASRPDAEKAAEELALEQSAELPAEVIPETLRDHSTGRVGKLEELPDGGYEAEILYPLSLAGEEITQCLNLLFGNSSLKPGIRLTGLEWKPLGELFPGPSLGIAGIRKRLGIGNRPLGCTAIKPVGLDTKQLGELCYRIALGGIDIIKDDHSLANQRSAPFAERLRVCLDAVDRAADKTGRRAAYYPNITGDGFETWRRYEIARELGADGVLLMPQLSGPGIIRSLKGNGSSLPVMAHPAFSGSYVLHPDQGISPSFLYGELWRAMGADAVIYPNAGGRFNLNLRECEAINGALRDESLPFRTALPVPAGGIGRDSIGEWVDRYGPDTIFLVGGSLYRHPEGMTAAVGEFQERLERYTP